MRALLPLMMLVALGCDSPSDGSGQEGQICTTAGFKCSTPTCSQFPTTPGCDYVDPMNAHCPIERPQCWDPSKNMAYCDPQKAICAKQKMQLPPQCPAMLCSANDVAVCNDTNTNLFCTGGYGCTPFGCADGGVGDGGMVDQGAVDQMVVGDN